MLYVVDGVSVVLVTAVWGKNVSGCRNALHLGAFVRLAQFSVLCADITFAFHELHENKPLSRPQKALLNPDQRSTRWSGRHEKFHFPSFSLDQLRHCWTAVSEYLARLLEAPTSTLIHFKPFLRHKLPTYRIVAKLLAVSIISTNNVSLENFTLHVDV